MENTQNEKEKDKGWFRENWQTALIIAGIGLLTGGTSGGVVATKGVSPIQGLTEEKADVRYLSKTEAERRIEERNRQIDKLDKENLKTAVFEAYHSNDEKRMERIEKMVEQVLENQNRYPR